MNGKSPVVEQLEGALETTLHQLGADQADALRAAAEGDMVLANQHLSDAEAVTKQAVNIATVLEDEMNQPE